MMMSSIKQAIEDSITTKQALLQDELLLGQIQQAVEACLKSLKSGGKILFCGNGGSFADAQHLSAEFTARFLFDRAALPSLALGTNSSTMTAVSNDYGYDYVFSREIEGIGNQKDVFFGLSTSGNSPNVIKAVEAATGKNIQTFILTGESGGKMRDMATSNISCLCVPSTETARIQECHILIGHLICGLAEEQFFKES